MLTIQGESGERFCDGISRRNFLRVGALGLGGLSLPQWLKAEAQSPRTKTQKSIIMIFLAGGPPHQDMFDLKMDAPSEIRGEFSPIRTKVPGIEICELFPKVASMMDKFSVIRSIVGAHGGHDAFQCYTGRSPRNAPPGGWPSIGAVMTRLCNSSKSEAPPFVGLSPKTQHRPWGDPGQTGFLGPSCAAFQPNGGGAEDMILTSSGGRLNDRRGLLREFDRFRKQTDASGAMDGMDVFTQQAFGMLTSSKLFEALDIEREDPKVRERYGKGSKQFQDDGPYAWQEQFLMARRLVEAGVRCVTLSFGRWDWHGGNFARARQNFPMLDQGVSSLVQDLHDRGMDQDVSVVVWGEFGRTPQINKDAGRDHWPQVSCALLAGGGMKHGQVIGATDRLGGEAADRPVDFQEVFSTLYHNVGIDARNTTIDDLTGRPRYLVDQQFAPMPELV